MNLIKPIKIGFVLASNVEKPIPSTRIAVLNMFSFLRIENFEPHIAFSPKYATETPEVSHLLTNLIEEKFQIICFQKVHGASVEKLAQQLSLKGIKTVYIVCDLVNPVMAELTDATIIVTEYLKNLYPFELKNKISVVHDGIEYPDIYKNNSNNSQGSKKQPLRAIIVTSSNMSDLPVIEQPPEWLHISIVGNYPPSGSILERIQRDRWTFLAKQGFKQRFSYLRFLTNPRITRIAWDPVSVYKEMQRADIGIIPIDTNCEKIFGKIVPNWKVKSENRLTLKMSVGLPVIATPIPAYKPLIEQGVNGFLAESKQDWYQYFDILRDPDVRQTIGNNARETVIQRYSIEEQAKKFISVLRNLVCQ